MRKTLGLLCAAAMLLPIGVIAAQQSASAAGGTTCSKGGGTSTITPGYHALQPAAQAETHETTATLKSKGTLSGCSGGGVTSAKSIVSTLQQRDPTNCNSLIDLKEPPASPPTTGPITITWNNGKTSTIGTATLSGVTPPAQATLKVTGKVTKGLFTGMTASGVLTFKPGSGQCVATPFTSATYTNKGPFKIA
jgi:hypothetical protein